jgi:putative ABC transport system ATP-binding protein
MTPPLLQLCGVSKSYASAAGTSVVLADVSLTIERGQKVSLMGPSGSGKSTLLSVIAGLLRPDTGSIELDGISLAGLEESARAQVRSDRIGIARQSENLIPFLTAAENVELALSFGPRRRDHGRTRELLECMHVAHCEDRLPRHLSGGETQRVSMAVALANDPAILLADEMVSALDSDTAARVVQELFAGETAVLFATHDFALADRADRRLCLRDQTVVPR